jgi:hypothetical protein
MSHAGASKPRRSWLPQLPAGPRGRWAGRTAHQTKVGRKAHGTPTRDHAVATKERPGHPGARPMQRAHLCVPQSAGSTHSAAQTGGDAESGGAGTAGARGCRGGAARAHIDGPAQPPHPHPANGGAPRPGGAALTRATPASRPCNPPRVTRPHALRAPLLQVEGLLPEEDEEVGHALWDAGPAASPPCPAASLGAHSPAGRQAPTPRTPRTCKAGPANTPPAPHPHRRCLAATWRP